MNMTNIEELSTLPCFEIAFFNYFRKKSVSDDCIDLQFPIVEPYVCTVIDKTSSLVSTTHRFPDLLKQSDYSYASLIMNN